MRSTLRSGSGKDRASQRASNTCPKRRKFGPVARSALLSRSPPHTAAKRIPSARASSSTSARIVPAPHIGSSTTWRALIWASRAIAAATVGRKEAGKCSSL